MAELALRRPATRWSTPAVSADVDLRSGRERRARQDRRRSATVVAVERRTSERRSGLDRRYRDRPRAAVAAATRDRLTTLGRQVGHRLGRHVDLRV